MVLKTRPCHRCQGTGKLLDPHGVARTLQEIRVRKGYNKTQIARKMGFTTAYICDLEKGIRDWRQELVERYLEACK